MVAYLVYFNMEVYFNTLIDYALKSKVMHNGLHILQKDVSKTLYAEFVLMSYGEIINHKYDFDFAHKLDLELKQTMPVEWDEARKINYAYYSRVKRLKNKIAKMLESGNCIFLTFTFTDKVLESTNADTRRQKVRRYLSSYNCDYVANIDFGAKNGREHYHALIQTDKVDYKAFDYGALNGEKVRSTNDFVKLAKYISKLTNHAIKDTCKGSRMIYNR